MRRAVTALLFLSTLFAATARVMAGEPSNGDTLSFVRWQAHLAGTFRLRETSLPVPWNEDPGDACENDRLALLGHAGSAGFDLFLKGASGCGPGRTERQSFLLEQGHLGWVGAGGRVVARYLVGERTLRDSHHLFQVLSDDSQLAAKRGEGVAVDAAAGGILRLSARKLRFHDAETVRLNGGLPAPADDGDDCTVVRLEGRAGGARMGFLAAEVRRLSCSTVFNSRASSTGCVRADRALFGLDGSVELGGIVLTAECLRSAAGRWDEVEGNLLGIDPGGGALDRPSGFVGKEGALAVEIDGLRFISEKWGTFGAVPGWRAVGSGFMSELGEMQRNLVQTTVTSWWRHPSREAMVFLDGADTGRIVGEECGKSGTIRVRARLRGGLDVTAAGSVAEGRRPWYALSLLDDGDRARARAAVRLDGTDGNARISFLGSGWMNVGRHLTARGLLYLGRERLGYFSVGAEYRPDDRFLFTIDYGSIDVLSPVGVALERSMLLDADPPLPRREEQITISSRIWFGTL